MTGNCNLCKERKELQKRSHIIPDFFYRESQLYHENHNLVILDLMEFLKNGKKNVASSKQKSGEYDQYVLCRDCDGKVINEYESYGREFFYGENNPTGNEKILRNHNGYVECLNADYRKLKLLFLSILWRADLSKRILFKEIDLGKKREELGEMVLYGNPKTDIDFPVFFMHTLFDTDLSEDYVFQPIKMKIGDEDGYMFAFSGFFIFFTFGIKGIPQKVLDIRIQEKGIFRALNVPPGAAWELIKDWYKNP